MISILILPVSTSSTARIEERFTGICLPHKCPSSQIAGTISELIRGLITGKGTGSSSIAADAGDGVVAE